MSAMAVRQMFCATMGGDPESDISMRLLFKVHDSFGLIDKEEEIFDSENVFKNGPMLPSIADELKDLGLLDMVLEEQYIQIQCEVKIQKAADIKTKPKPHSSTMMIQTKDISTSSQIYSQDTESRQETEGEPGSPLLRTFTSIA